MTDIQKLVHELDIELTDVMARAIDDIKSKYGDLYVEVKE